jgi:hypothetical protein
MMSKPATPAAGSGVWPPKIGSNHFSMWLPPPSKCGMPTQPPTMERTASIMSGMVMIFGDSWMWCCTSSDARDSPWKVEKNILNM